MEPSISYVTDRSAEEGESDTEAPQSDGGGSQSESERGYMDDESTSGKHCSGNHLTF